MKGHACLAVNIGNTRSTVARLSPVGILTRQDFPTADTSPNRMRRALLAVAQSDPIDGGILCSVVPAVNATWVKGLADLTGRLPLVVSAHLRLGFHLSYPQPSTLGADRLANLAAVAACGKVPAIVVDVGTATTLDALTAGRRFMGGIIVPGPALFTEYLADRTARLPRVAIQGAPGSIGRSTRGAIRVGLHIGYAGMIQSLLIRLLRHPALRFATIVFTGGYGRWLARRLPRRGSVRPDLTLRGLRHLYDLNTPPRCSP